MSNSKRPMTDRQREVMNTIIVLTDQKGVPPTLREIGDRLGISSTNAVNDHLRRLMTKGYLKDRPIGLKGTGIARSLFLTEKAKAEFKINPSESGSAAIILAEVVNVLLNDQCNCDTVYTLKEIVGLVTYAESGDGQ